MTYLLDTNAWIAVLRANNASILAQLQCRPSSDILMCSVVVAELWYGVFRSAEANRSRNENLVRELCGRYASLPFDDAAAICCAEVRAALGASGRPIGPNDVMIAAIARVHGLTLVTHNTSEFARVPGLLIEDWQVN